MKRSSLHDRFLDDSDEITFHTFKIIKSYTRLSKLNATFPLQFWVADSEHLDVTFES